MKKKICEKLIKKSLLALKYKDIPISAFVLKNDEIIGIGFNKKNKENIVTRHAEIIAIENANKKIKNWRLNDCVLFTTLKPCDMCVSAMIQARIKKCYYLLENHYYNNKIEISNEIIFEKITNEFSVIYEKILLDFFKRIRK